MRTPFIWNTDPVIARLGPLAFRYYGLCFALALLTGFFIWHRRVRRFGESEDFAWHWLWWSLPAVMIGGRLGFCFFYQPKTYLADPLRVFAVWQGGLSSHGVTLGLVVALWGFSRQHRITWTRLGDYFAPAVALAVGWVRVGNFFNSEVLGHATTVPWAVIFARIDAVPRHPAQLYDLLIGPATWLVLRIVERRNIRPMASGLISGAFLTVYFGLRIGVEEFKEFYVEQLRLMTPFREIEAALGVTIHTGQWLSVVPVCAGLWFIVRALRHGDALSIDARSAA